MKSLIALTAAIAALSSTQASAAVFNFTFDSTSTFLGDPQSIRGTFTTSDVPVTRFNQTAFVITGISGTINGDAITGLFDIANNPYYYFTTGPTFLDGSGVRFNAGGFTNIAFFHQDGAAVDQYRVNGHGTVSAFGPATSSPAAAGAVPEPASWAMMMLGFGAMGYAMRRRAKVATRVRFA